MDAGEECSEHVECAVAGASESLAFIGRGLQSTGKDKWKLPPHLVNMVGKRVDTTTIEFAASKMPAMLFSSLHDHPWTLFFTGKVLTKSKKDRLPAKSLRMKVTGYDAASRELTTAYLDESGKGDDDAGKKMAKSVHEAFGT